MIGLDIGTYSIKAVELQKTDSVFTLLGCGIQRRYQEKALGDDLTKFFKDTKFNSKELMISVSGHLVLVKMVELPTMEERELKNAVKFEIERSLSYKIEESMWDYKVISKNDESKKALVLLAAAKGELIKKYLDPIAQAGFVVNGVDIDGIAIANAFQELTAKNNTGGVSDAATAVFNIGESFLNISVVYHGLPFVIRDIRGGGREFTEALGKGLGISNEEALKVKHGTLPEERERISDLLRPILIKLTKEIELSFGYFENQFGKNIDFIYLSGGSSKLFGLKDFLAETFETKVEFLNPFDSIKLSAGVSAEFFEGAKQELVVALGLALRDD